MTVITIDFDAYLATKLLNKVKCNNFHVAKITYNSATKSKKCKNVKTSLNSKNVKCIKENFYNYFL